MKNSTKQSTHINKYFENAINHFLEINRNNFLEINRNSLEENDKFIEEIRSDLFKSFSGEIFTDEHKDMYERFTGSEKHWDAFKSVEDKNIYDDFAGTLVSSYLSNVKPSTHVNKDFEKAISNYLNSHRNYLEENNILIDNEFIKKIRLDLLEGFAGEIFTDEHKDIYERFTGSAKHWGDFKSAEDMNIYDDFAGVLVSDYLSKKLFSEALHNASSQIKNPILQSATNKISSELVESFVFNMTKIKFIEEDALNGYKAIFKNLEMNDEIWNEFYEQGEFDLYKNFAESLCNKIVLKLSAEHYNIFPKFEVLPLHDALKELTYEYYSGDIIPTDLSQELSGALPEDA